MTPIDIIIPTFDNPEYFHPCLRSLLTTRWWWPLRVIVVNNGHPESVSEGVEGVEVLTPGANLGWEGGLTLGLERSSSEFVVFSNDDIFLAPFSGLWARTMLQSFRDPTVAAVGPVSNCVMGPQNIFNGAPVVEYTVPFLIGFFVMVRRSALEAIGGIDDTLPGGDDLDLGIRFRQAGYRLVVRPDGVGYHHGVKTGERGHGGPNTPEGWISHGMQERTDNALIHKHGFTAWNGLWTEAVPTTPGLCDAEGDAVRAWVNGGRVLELGCGARKTVPQAIGVDLVPGGEISYRHEASVADVIADAFGPMPIFDDHSADTIIARHLFEHAPDPVGALLEWRRLLKPQTGKLILACPNENLNLTIPMDPTHKHAWTPESLRSLAERCGYRQVAYTPNCGNGLSFITVLEPA